MAQGGSGQSVLSKPFCLLLVKKTETVQLMCVRELWLHIFMWKNQMNMVAVQLMEEDGAK